MQSYINFYILTTNHINISKISLHHNKLQYYKGIASHQVCQIQMQKPLCIDKVKNANLLIGSTLEAIYKYLFENVGRIYREK